MRESIVMKASIRPSPRPAQSSGQILAVFAIGLFAMFALVALVIEGGNIFIAFNNEMLEIEA